MVKTFWTYKICVFHYEKYCRSKWESDNSTDVLVKSGNPGYLTGAPVLSGIQRADEEASYIVQVVSGFRLTGSGSIALRTN